MTHFSVTVGHILVQPNTRTVVSEQIAFGTFFSSFLSHVLLDTRLSSVSPAPFLCDTFMFLCSPPGEVSTMSAASQRERGLLTLAAMQIAAGGSAGGSVSV